MIARVGAVQMCEYVCSPTRRKCDVQGVVAVAAIPFTEFTHARYSIECWRFQVYCCCLYPISQVEISCAADVALY